jgi:pyruvate dehydrogenase E1 component alpha subunit
VTRVDPAPIAEDDLELLLLIRRFEETLLELFAAGQVSGTTHTCLGQEYVPVVLAPLLRGDFVFSNHRGHGHYLAHCGDPEGLLAEILGRDGAVCHGVGGSQHLRRPGFVSTGVQGESIPAAVGVALHFRHVGERRVAVAYVGDGTWGEGGVYEGLNMAKLWEVPLLVVVEHNRVAQSTPSDRQLAGTLPTRAAAFGIGCAEVTGSDVAAIREAVRPVVDKVRADRQPHVIVFHTARLGPHSKGDDSRPAEEVAALRETDWLASYRSADPDRVAAAEARVRRRLDAAVETVLGRPLSTWTDR